MPEFRERHRLRVRQPGRHLGVVRRAEQGILATEQQQRGGGDAVRRDTQVARDLALIEHRAPDVRRDARRLTAHVVLDLRIESRHFPPDLHERRVRVDRVFQRPDLGIERAEGGRRTRRVSARQTATADGRTDDHQPIDTLRPEGREGLGDHAAERMAGDMRPLQPELIHEELRVMGEVEARVATGRFARLAVPTLIDQEHPVVLRKQAPERQVAERAVGEAMEEHQRRLAGVTQLDVTHLHPVGEHDGLALGTPRPLGLRRRPGR